MFRDLTDQLERIYSPRLALRRLALSDGWPLFKASQNPDFNRHLMWDQPQGEEAMLERVDAILGAMRRGRLAAVSATVRETGEWVSLYRFLPYEGDPTTMEMGVWTHPRFWRDSYTVELTRMCVDAAFRCSRAERLIARAALENAGSFKVLEKVGLRPARKVTGITESGRPVPGIEHALSRRDWLASASLEPSYREVPLYRDFDAHPFVTPTVRETAIPES